MLRGLSGEELSKIVKITLFDDVNTTDGWDWLQTFVDIPVEHVEVDRILDRKSLVDMRMAVETCKDFYQGGIDSFILASSDSDFWGLISSMPDTRFMVAYEYEKISPTVRQAFHEHGVRHCAMDDFSMAQTDDLKKAILFAELRKHVGDICGKDPMELTKRLYAAARVKATDQEMVMFCNKYVKTLKLVMDENGRFAVEIQN